MAPRLFRIFVFALLTIGLLGPSPSQASDKELRSTITFTSTRDFPGQLVSEIYLMNPDGTDPRRLTNNDDGEVFSAISPDGKKIVFDSNRRRISGEPNNTSDLFLMNTDGSEQTFLTRGSSASWSPDSKFIAYHASASGTGLPITPQPGSATTDSDLFVINVDDCLEHGDACQVRNLTNNGSATIEEDVDWSPVPDANKIVFTSNSPNDYGGDSAEIYVMNADGTNPTNLTNNGQHERAPEWSPDGEHIAYTCREPEQTGELGEICAMNADGTGQTQLTNTDPPLFNGTATWSPDGTQIAFHRSQLFRPFRYELWMMNADGTGQTQLTNNAAFDAYANWGVVKTTGQDAGQVAAGDDGRGHDGTADHGKQDKANKDNKHKHDKHKKGGGRHHR